MSAIRGAAELLEEKMQPRQRARFLSNIRNEANRIQALVDRMLELSALENQKILKNVEQLSASTLFQTVYESKRVILKKKQLHLTVQVPENIQLRGDKLLLHQALSNLIQNAIDFSPAHSEMKLRAQIEGTMLALVVEDSGTGIPAYASGKVFNKFFSLQRPDSGKKSTGLGLNFVQEVATLHNGKIELQNLPEKGVRATMLLPCVSPGANR